MSERGVFAVDRGIWDHPIFQTRAPLSKREAWLWLVSEASWKARSVRMEGRTVNLTRGQLVHSIRFMADKWGWPKSNVSRFLDTLKTETMIGTQSGTGLTIITICKYDEYQKVSLPDRDSVGTPSGTVAGHERDKDKDIEDIEQGSVPRGTAPSAPVDLFTGDVEILGEDPKAKLFRIGKTVLVSFGIAEKRTGALLGQWLKARPDPTGLLAAIQFARQQNVAEPISYISAVIAGKGATNGRQPRQSLADRARELAEQARRIELAEGIGGSADAFGGYRGRQ